jgi:ubiquinone/menaquinone biosynthesis C-methylase UbiE
MKHLICICGNKYDFRTVYEQNFTENLIDQTIFSARGKRVYESCQFHYRILECKKCLQLFSSPILEDDKIIDFYQKSHQTYTDEAENIVNSYLRPLKKYNYLLNEKESCLEVACGSGFCLEAIRNLGFKKIVGIEPSTHAVAQAKDHIKAYIKNCSFEDTTFEDNSMDLICAFQVFDHFVNPKKVASEFNRILKPGGLCYVIIHNVKAFHVRILKEKSPIIDVSHIYYFNKKTINNLLQTAGFEIISNFAIWNTYTLNTWLRMTPIPFKNLIEKILNFTRTNNMSFSVPAGNIGVIAKKLN